MLPVEDLWAAPPGQRAGRQRRPADRGSPHPQDLVDAAIAHVNVRVALAASQLRLPATRGVITPEEFEREKAKIMA